MREDEPRTPAEIYDLFYGACKDYVAEAAALSTRLRAHDPGCRSVLDLACGTGEHARWLAAVGFEVDGVDLDAGFIDLARAKHPDGRFSVADMREFALPDRYDAIVCLFGSIGYALDPVGLERVVQRCAAHLTGDGSVLIEPFVPPAPNGKIVVDSVGFADGHLRRRCRCDVSGDTARLQFEYELQRGGQSVVFRETHELAIFTEDDFEAAFIAAGLASEYDPVGPAGYGAYIGRTVV